MSSEQEDFTVSDMRENPHGICDTRGWPPCFLSPEGHLVVSQEKKELPGRRTL